LLAKATSCLKVQNNGSSFFEMTLRITVQGFTPCVRQHGGRECFFTAHLQYGASVPEQENGRRSNQQSPVCRFSARKETVTTFVVETESTPGDSCSLVIDVSKMKTLKFLTRKKEKSYRAPVLRPAAPAEPSSESVVCFRWALRLLA
jgi:hypothetical protein